MYTIEKSFHFSASHRLNGLPETHPCSRLHGHNYLVIVHLSAPSLQNNFVLDYRELDPIKKYIDDVLDHRHLNDVLPIETTAENLARYLYDKFKPVFESICAITIKETEKTAATYAG